MLPFLPKSPLGKKATLFLLMAFLFFVIFNTLISFSNTKLEAPESFGNFVYQNPFLFIFGLFSFIFIILSSVFAFVSVIKKKERAILTFIEILIGIIIVFLVVGEFIGPVH
jgi:hypothetical protein